jgi:hypothetical protein
MWRGQLELLLDECIGVNASFEAIMGAWLTTSQGLLRYPLCKSSTQPVSLQLRNIFPDAKTDTR